MSLNRFIHLRKSILCFKPINQLNFECFSTKNLYFPHVNCSNLTISSKTKFSIYSRNSSKKENSSPFSFQSLSEPSNTNNHSNTNGFKFDYETIAEETLESLSDKFDNLAEELDDSQTKDYDVEYSSGVLNIKLGPRLGTYVLNKQTPNLQIWLSSPTSGPKRFDFIDNTWIYKRTNESLHDLLSK